MPCGDVFVQQGAFDHVLAVGLLGSIQRVHDVVTELGLNDLGVACFMTGEDPVIEGGDHLTLVHIGVQTAGGAVAVIGLLVSQSSEGILGSVAVLPLVVDGLSLCQSGSLLLVGVGGVAVGIGGAALEGSQDVTDVSQIVLVLVALDEVDHIVAGDGHIAIGVGGGGGQVDHFASLAGFVSHPALDRGGNVGVLGVGVGGGLGGGGLGVDFQSGDGSVQSLHGGDLLGDQGSGSSLGSQDGSGLLLVGVGHSAVLVLSAAFQEAGGAQVVGVVGEEGVGVGILVVLGLDLVSGVLHGISDGVLVHGCQVALLEVSADGLAVGTGAVHGSQVFVDAGVVVVDGVVGQGSHLGVDGGLVILGQGEAVGFCLVADGVDGLDVVLGAGLELVCPSGAGLFIDDLLVQSLGHVQTVQGGIGAHLAVEIGHGVNVEAVVLHGADLVVAHSGSHGGTAGFGFLLGLHGQVDAVIQGDADGEDHHQGNDCHHDDGQDLQFLGFGLLGQLLFGELLGTFRIAKLLLAGCTHLVISSSRWVYAAAIGGQSSVL